VVLLQKSGICFDLEIVSGNTSPVPITQMQMIQPDALLQFRCSGCSGANRPTPWRSRSLKWHATAFQRFPKILMKSVEIC
jgi:hypothetical protein